MKIDKLYIVSLDWDTDSVQGILDVVNQVGLPYGIPYEVLGIQGSELTKHHMSLMGVKLYDDWNLNNGNVVIDDSQNRFWQRDVTQGEVGCALSHISIWEDAYKNQYENILVYEDDIVFKDTMDWNQFDKVRTMNYDLFYLGRLIQDGFDNVVDKPIDDMICKPGYSYQTHA